MTPADELRAAADKLRTLTTADGIEPGPWRTEWHEQQYELLSADPTSVAITEWTYAIATWEPQASEQRAECDTANADYIATMHPSVGSALAAWLESTATALAANTHPGWQECVAPHAIAVARAINGGEQQ
ncbi:hypothetical protein [Streptomyces sp. NPDC053367]|uniref:hypothetical protein n=1 Tax=Streptomyces sp. NPDC053367 TaxID=3365700 RepID=UPI0037D47AFF